MLARHFVDYCPLHIPHFASVPSIIPVPAFAGARCCLLRAYYRLVITDHTSRS
jgi:hypothetical protein